MGQNLKNAVRSELIKQRRLGARLRSRNSIKNAKGGKMADYRHIFSDNSYKDHLAQAQKFAEHLRNDTSIRKLSEIKPEDASDYLKKLRDEGYSASTIGSAALAINHIMIGSGNWEESQKIVKSNIEGMPKRSITDTRYKQLDSQEWRDRNRVVYEKYKEQIDTIRAFGLRRRELSSGTSLSGHDGIGPKTVFRAKNGLLVAQTMGKGGKLRFAECRKDMADEMEAKYGQYARPISEAARTPAYYRKMIKANKPFFHGFKHSVPTHIFRSEYAQHKLVELNQVHYQGYRTVKRYVRAGKDANGKQLYKQVYKKLNLADKHTIGSYTASYGSFFKLSSEMGHNRLDVLNSYLGVGR